MDSVLAIEPKVRGLKTQSSNQFLRMGSKAVGLML
jgi:hypothetical protein